MISNEVSQQKSNGELLLVPIHLGYRRAQCEKVRLVGKLLTDSGDAAIQFSVGCYIFEYSMLEECFVEDRSLLFDQQQQQQKRKWN